MSILKAAKSLHLSGSKYQVDYAEKLLLTLGACTEKSYDHNEHPVDRWLTSGLLSLCGEAGEPGLPCPVPLPDCADGALLALQVISKSPQLCNLNAAALLSERARLLDLSRQGSIAPGGSCRILNTRTSPIALNMARSCDWTMLSALFEETCTPDWASIARNCKSHDAATLTAQGRLLGMAITPSPSELPTADWLITQHFEPVIHNAYERPTVLDLSSLWAGPLCSSLLHTLGAKVIKFECQHRPDGARRGNQTFFQLINQGKRGASLNLRSKEGQQRLLALIEKCDIIIEGSRPRALMQMGIDAQQVLTTHPGKTWMSITAYGRTHPQNQYIGFGDDTGVAAGLSEIMRVAYDRPYIVGDAIADPLTGLHAALAAWASWQSGGGKLLELSLYATIKHCIESTSPFDNDYLKRAQRWAKHLEKAGKKNILLPLRGITNIAPRHGQHNAELGLPC